MADPTVGQSGASSSNMREARRLAEEVVKRDDTKLTEALLADAIGHLVDEIEEIRSRVETLQNRSSILPDPSAWAR